MVDVQEIRAVVVDQIVSNRQNSVRQRKPWQFDEGRQQYEIIY